MYYVAYRAISILKQVSLTLSPKTLNNVVVSIFFSIIAKFPDPQILIKGYRALGGMLQTLRMCEMVRQAEPP